MELKCSCACGKVKFSCLSDGPYPYNICHCNGCRKIQGGGGFCINIIARTNSLNFEKGAKENLKLYKTTPESKQEKWFCQNCGSYMFVKNYSLLGIVLMISILIIFIHLHHVLIQNYQNHQQEPI